MTLQLSVILWTVICFCAAMLILRRLLFRPFFEVMDRRKAHIASAKERQSELEEAEASAREAEARSAAEAEAELQRLLARRAGEESQAHAAALAAARSARVEELEQYRQALEQEKQELWQQLEPHVAQLADELLFHRVSQ